MDTDILSNEQKEALKRAITFLESDDEDFILTGAAGTGKSFLVDYIIKEAIDRDFNTHRTASTNKAAKVISGGTIHALLGLKPKNDYSKGVQTLEKSHTPVNMSSYDVIVIDESSMVDSQLLDMILKYSGGAKLFFVGDQYQLPPIFEPTSPALNEADVELKEVQRQALTSPIIPFATKFREVLDGKSFPIPKTIGKDIVVLEGKAFHKRIKKSFTSDEYINNSDYCKVLAWTNSEVGKYNRMIRKFWHPAQYQEGEVLIVNSPITAMVKGKDVIIFKNETQVRVMSAFIEERQGIMGQVIKITSAVVDEGCRTATIFVADSREDVQRILKQYAEEALSLRYELKNVGKHTTKWFELDEARRNAWRLYFSIKSEFADVRPVHASTVHKSQGSTYETVFIDVDDISKNRSSTEIARLMYVAITRARSTVYLKGQLPRRLYT